MEIDSQQVPYETIGILSDDPNGLVSVGPDDLYGEFRRDPVIDEEVHGDALGLPVGPASGDEVAALLPEALQGKKLLGVFVEHVENLFAERLEKALRIDGADPLDEAGAETLSDVLLLGGEFRADHFRPKLMALLAGLPAARCMNEEVRRHGRRKAHDRLGSPAFPVGDAKNAEAVFRIMEGDALDHAFHFGGRARLFGLTFFWGRQ